MICWKCKKEIPLEKPARSDECPLCHADLHVCKACDFYESGAHNDCRESSAEMVTDKERANFCDYFRVNKKLSAVVGAEGSDAGLCGKSKEEEARNAAAALFGEVPSDSVSSGKSAKDAFNALFG